MMQDKHMLEIKKEDMGMKKFLLFIILICPTIVFSVDNEGPFGLNWGSKPKEIISAGISLLNETNQGRFKLYEVKSLPKNLSIAENYILIFDNKYGLQKVVMISKNITGDIYGTEGKNIYSDFKIKLTNKYGPPQSFERIGVKLYDEMDEFYQCLSYEGCGIWSSVFNSDSLVVGLDLKGIGRGVGYIEIVYEGPLWQRSLDDKNSDDSKSDDDAL